MLVLGGGVDGALGVARAADGRGHALGRDEGPVAAAVGGVLQPHAVGEGRGLAAAHADLKLQEGRAGDLKVPALCVPGLLCGVQRGQGEGLKVTLGFIRLQSTRLCSRAVRSWRQFTKRLSWVHIRSKRQQDEGTDADFRFQFYPPASV